MSDNLYAESGVDIEKGESLVNWLTEDKEIKPAKGAIVSDIGGFSALFRPDFSDMEKPLLVSGTDGVGTKLLLGLQHKNLSGLGIDLVAMCVNDLYTLGATPLFFLDYYATGKLDAAQFKEVLSSIKTGLKQCQCSLMGGETAELPGLYSKNHFDLAGFVVGAVDEAKVLGPKKVTIGDKLYAFKASGFHSNGYSLIRKWLKKEAPSEGLINNLLKPTQIYHQVPKLVEAMGPDIHAIANITGGGISGNLPRVMPENVTCHVSLEKLPIEKWMKDFITTHANIDKVESVFNLGAGMIAAIDSKKSEKFENLCEELKLNIKEIGEVKSKTPNETVIFEG